jgi:hypothetical protein
LPEKSVMNASKPVSRLSSLLTSTLGVVNMGKGLVGERGGTCSVLS